ncbi:MAG: type I restriction enzyme HsdR N-terminal domain-containing protein [Myxococcales bacterium]|nr:type I restriction enzyme HsdR N-terminal domain-containing protein [Myxococcales bacterium]MCB9703355.1 type I restriction enzyme HsdR N-terminal domain-containing protein [Myxococcales bacterium]
MFENKLKALSQRVPTVLPHLDTEEATKTALIMPFIAALGYDVFDPSEVIPEFTADVGIKKGEKVDYAIKRDGEIIILIEAKKAKAELNPAHCSQLFRYFTVTKARIAILTNGIRYQFYSDLDEQNKMDSKPFFELDLRDLRDSALAELRGLTKEGFNLEEMLTAAAELKSLREIRLLLERQLEQPDDDFARFFFAQSNPSKKFVQSARDAFVPLVKKALVQLINDRVQDRLRLMMRQADAEAQEADARPRAEVDAEPDEGDEDAGRDGVVTTEEELAGFEIVRSIVAKVVPPERVTYRDTKSYFNVLFDDNGRKPLCRLYLNRSKKYVGLFDGAKNQTKVPIADIQEIHRVADALQEAARRYLQEATAKANPSSS